MKGDLQRSIDIDVKINELKKRQFTPDNANLLGDLYLKKGDKKAAVEYFYFAARNSHKDKAVAIYKKIVRLARSETKAYEELIDIFSQEGLVAEEIKYLLSLAQVYQSRSDTQKETEIFRKIDDLDPDNNAAKLFFSRGKVVYEEVIPEEESVEMKDEVLKEEEREVEDRAPEREGISLPVWRKFFIIGVGVVFFLGIIAGIFSYVSYRGKRRVEAPRIVKESAPSAGKSLPSENIKAFQKEAYAIEATPVTGDLLRQMLSAARLTEKEISDNSFLQIKVKAGKACISEDLVKYPDRRVSLIDREGNRIAPREIRALDGLKKVIYRPYACGKESDIVYAHFYLAYPKEAIPVRVLVEGLKIVFEKNTDAGYTSRGND
ncbi:MAG TPA: hypothetical protein DCP92_11615 [Nitrospiraceae bacterium]|nr:hypothetical protein [Nitrospiraceae bacterium]